MVTIPLHYHNSIIVMKIKEFCYGNRNDGNPLW